MKIANSSTSLGPPPAGGRLFGTGANWQLGVWSRSTGESSLVMPISTL